jgi:RNA polymerase sigma-70 factor, ECF subfamily
MTSSDRDQFTEQFVRNQHRIFAYIVTVVRDRDDAEDIYQSTSLILWKKWKECGPPNNFFGWACGIAHNQVRNMLRIARPGRLQLSEDVAMLVAQVREKTDELLEMRSQFLPLCLSKLSDEQRKLIERCYLGEESIKTIAEDMQISPAALTMRLQRIRKMLFKCIESASDVERKDAT